jgi:hypothetical protein
MKTVKKSTYSKNQQGTNLICSAVRCASNGISAKVETVFKKLRNNAWDKLAEDQRISMAHAQSFEVQIRFCSGFSDLQRKYAIKFKNLKKCFEYINKTVEEEGSDYLALREFIRRGDLDNTGHREMMEEERNF